MSEQKRTSIKWLDKLKKIKHIEIYIAVIFVVVLLLVYLSSTGNNKKQSSDYTETNIMSYVDNLETNLEEILSNIAGVTNVKVMITLNMQQLEVQESNVIINKFPEIKGVLITAKGVESTSIKLKVLHAVQAVIDVTNGNIEVLSSE